MKLQLKRFDMSSIGDDRVIMLIGKRDTGKSYLVRDLLSYHTDIPVGTVISPTECANPFYGKMVPPVFIHDDYDPSIIENVIKRQRQVVPRSKAGEAIDPRAFLIMDDCLYDTAWSRDVNIRSAFLNGRHYRLFYVVTSQYALGLPPILRNNIDYTFILRDPYMRSRKILYENYAGMFPNFKAFNDVMNACTNNFECLVIHNTSRSNRIEDQVFWYKAPEHSDFRLGAKEFWDKDKQARFAKEHRDRASDAAVRRAGKNGGLLDVEKLH
jgi:hypothetical protein